MSLKEEIAELEHKQWEEWSQTLANTETISTARLERWNECWKDYKLLTEEQKDYDRLYANKVLALPSLQATIEKAKKFDKQFEGLKVEEECGKCKGDELSDMYPLGLPIGRCGRCNATGKTLRDLTEDEKEEFVKITIETRINEYNQTCLSTGTSSSIARVVRG